MAETIRSIYFTQHELNFSRAHLTFDVLDHKARLIGEGLFHRGQPPHPATSVEQGQVLLAAECWQNLFESNHRCIQIPVDYGIGLFGAFDDEWMADYGIAPFATGDRYVGGARDSEFGQGAYVYSQREMFGWMRLMMERIVRQFPDQKEALLNVERKYYNPADVAGLIDGKLSGAIGWDHGWHFAVLDEI